ncbi:hypothetical protein DXG01_014737 [Tephrocybe rancida]|nr:hypothetical protein DXG01_014737 [Tephrocybe rancida]
MAHLLPRIKLAFNIPSLSNSMTNAPAHLYSPDAENVFLAKETLYFHKIMRVNFTSYNARRSQDSFNPSTSHCDVMVLSGSASGHQFRYADALA